MSTDGIFERPRKPLLFIHFLVFCGVLTLLALPPFSARAEDRPPAVPVAEVQAEVLTPPAPAAGTMADSPAAGAEGSQTPAHTPVEGLATGPVVVELFTSQACSFCPKADALLGALANSPGVIALSCHVDYFDVKTGSLSHPFCGVRQVEYESTLRAGPKYTPQMVINGQYDVVGYRRADVLTTIRRARKERALVTPDLQITDKGEFLLSLPALEENEGSAEAYEIIIVAYDTPHTVTVAEGANAGKSIVYTNVVRNVGLLGPWDGQVKSLRFDPKMSEGSQGFAVLARRTADGQIVAAAQYTKPAPAPATP